MIYGNYFVQENKLSSVFEENEDEDELVIVAPELVLRTLTKSEFSSKVESIFSKNNISYLTAIYEACEEFCVEYESVRKFLSKTLLQKITIEASSENQLKKVYCEKTTSLI